MRDEGEQVSCCSGVVWCCALMASTLRGEEPLPWRQQGCVSQPAMTHAAESASRFAAPKPRWATQNSPPLSSGACFPSDSLSVSSCPAHHRPGYFLPQRQLRAIPTGPLHLSVRAGACHKGGQTIVRRWPLSGTPRLATRWGVWAWQCFGVCSPGGKLAAGDMCVCCCCA